MLFRSSPPCQRHTISQAGGNSYGQRRELSKNPQVFAIAFLCRHWCSSRPAAMVNRGRHCVLPYKCHPPHRMGTNRFPAVNTGETTGVAFLSVNPLLFLATQILNRVTWLGRHGFVPHGHPVYAPWRSSFPGFCAAACGRCAAPGCCPLSGRCPGRSVLSNGADC